MARTLEQELSIAGYRMLGDTQIEQLILSTLKSKNIRYLKAIPYFIFMYHPDLAKIYSQTKHKRLLAEIIGISRKIFQEDGLELDLPPGNTKTKLNYEEFKQEFDLQRKQAEPSMQDKQKIYAERHIEMWLSELFTRKEKIILKMILYKKPLSKTESEYYSRKTKKKLNAIINLQELAKAILPLGVVRNNPQHK